MSDNTFEPTDTTADVAPAERQAAVAKPSDVPARETDWKAEARKWEARAKANTQAARERDRLAEQIKSSEADLEALRAKVGEFERDQKVAQWREQVSKDTGVPALILRGESLEELQAHAEAINDTLTRARLYKPVPTAGQAPGKAAASPMAQVAASLFGRD